MLTFNYKTIDRPFISTSTFIMNFNNYNTVALALLALSSTYSTISLADSENIVTPKSYITEGIEKSEQSASDNPVAQIAQITKQDAPQRITSI